MENVSSVKRLIDANKLIDFIDVGHFRHPGELCYSESIEAWSRRIGEEGKHETL